MGCIWIALDRLKIKVTKRYSSEIDKYANIVNDANYPDTIQLGDVTQVKAIDLERIDLLVGGSPCQGFSFAGKQLNFEDPRSKLFFEFVRLLKECNPKYFLLENVRMKKEHQDVISKYLGVEPIEINSNLVSAQNRVRYYWTNLPGVEQPRNKGIKLIDVLEEGLKDDPIGAAVRGRYNEEGKTYQKLEVRKDDKSNCITTVGKDSLLALRNKSNCLRVGGRNSPFGSKQIWDSPFQRVSKKGKVKPSTEKAACLTGGANSGGNHSDMDILHSEYATRRYTTTECERLQTVPDNYTNYVSNSQRYKMLGNGWTVDVITHLLKQLS